MRTHRRTLVILYQHLEKPPCSTGLWASSPQSCAIFRRASNNRSAKMSSGRESKHDATEKMDEAVLGILDREAVGQLSDWIQNDSNDPHSGKWFEFASRNSCHFIIRLSAFCDFCKLEIFCYYF